MSICLVGWVAPITANGQANSTASPQPLTGSVRSQALAAETGVKELEETDKYLRRAAMDLISEVERQQYVTVGDPNVVGSVVIPAIPAPTGQLATGELLPARQKWINFYMTEASQAVEAMHNELGALAMPDEKTAQTSEPLNELKSRMDEVTSHYGKLRQVTQGPELVNLKIGAEALAIYDQTKPIEELLKKIFHLLKEKR
jgi:hypothetical protein